MSILQELLEGIHYFKTGWSLISRKGLRRFVVVPVLLNILFLIGLFWIFITQIDHQIDTIMTLLPHWLSWVSHILVFFAVAIILLVYYFIFNSLSGFIAAPFNGLLSEKVESMLTGEEANDDSIIDIIKDLPRTFKREWLKIWYSLPRIIILFILGFVPFIGQFIIPVIIFVFTAWSQTIQYCDYPFDNHKIPFLTMKNALKKKPYANFSFGVLVMICTFIPFINFVIIPVAICGATAMWVDNYRQHFITNKSTEVVEK
ncbi:sulfate transporter CysZ [Actinobacillus delphinicola]|uniref:Sulfate transporter CysZ n=1 Tax=Actinobacillus delphinicola TaxID=51161 RepID=A0A448TTG4_9PAST|nr:sulfate transporter CysZ [Actinobacillus delphinicola]VEJ09279.1 putative sulfate transport protein CysZ [Actinobacillus delphinicola]